MCAQQDSPHMIMTSTMPDNTRWTVDRLHKLFGIYAKWDNKTTYFFTTCRNAQIWMFSTLFFIFPSYINKKKPNTVISFPLNKQDMPLVRVAAWSGMTLRIISTKF